MNLVFKLVAGILYVLSLLFGVTYVEMNIIAYYFFIPITWVILLDAIFKFHWFKIIAFVGYIVLFLSIDNWTKFCAWVFRKSVTLLNFPYIWTEHEFSDVAILDNAIITNQSFVGPYYVRNSVIVCVFVPVVVYAVLIYPLVKK